MSGNKCYDIRSKSCLDCCSGILSLVCSKDLERLQITAFRVHTDTEHWQHLLSTFSSPVSLIKFFCSPTNSSVLLHLSIILTSWEHQPHPRLLSLTFHTHLRIFGNSLQCHSLDPVEHCSCRDMRISPVWHIRPHFPPTAYCLTWLHSLVPLHICYLFILLLVNSWLYGAAEICAIFVF